jgi:hypothetical protein
VCACVWRDHVNTDNFVCFCSLSPTPPASITSLVDASCESPDKSDENENQRLLCNSPRNNTNSSQSIKRDSPLPTTASLVDDVKKLEIRTSDPDLNRKFKTNSPLASSSNLSKPDPAVENLRFSSNNNENNSRKTELKWQCVVGVCYHVLFANLSFHFNSFVRLFFRPARTKTIRGA